MRKLLLAIVAGVMLAPMASGARDWGFIPSLQAAQGDLKKGSGQVRRGGGEDPRREKEARQPRDERQQGRLTDEQRRDLHRDLDRANREIYRQKGR